MAAPLVIEIITDAMQLIRMIDQNETPSAEQTAQALRILNDMLLNEAADGMRLGWFPQSSVTNTAPLRLQDVFGVKRILAGNLATANGIDLAKDDAVLTAEIIEAKRQLVKRSIRYFESDLGELQRAQGVAMGPNWA
jgi:hypothetical protein